MSETSQKVLIALLALLAGGSAVYLYIHSGGSPGVLSKDTPIIIADDGVGALGAGVDAKGPSLASFYIRHENGTWSGSGAGPFTIPITNASQWLIADPNWELMPATATINIGQVKITFAPNQLSVLPGASIHCGVSATVLGQLDCNDTAGGMPSNPSFSWNNGSHIAPHHDKGPGHAGYYFLFVPQ